MIGGLYISESGPYFSPSAVGVLPSQNVIILSNYYVYKMYILQLIKVKMKTMYSWCFFLSAEIKAGLKQFFAMFGTRSDVCHFKTIHELFVYLWMCSGNEITRNIKGKKAWRQVYLKSKLPWNTFMLTKVIPSYPSLRKDKLKHYLIQ